MTVQVYGVSSAICYVTQLYDQENLQWKTEHTSDVLKISAQ